MALPGGKFRRPSGEQGALAPGSGSAEEKEAPDTSDPRAALEAASVAISRADRLRDEEVRAAREAARRRRVQALTRSVGPGSGPLGASQMTLSMAEELVPPVKASRGAEAGARSSRPKQRAAQSKVLARAAAGPLAAGSGRAAAKARRSGKTPPAKKS